MAQDASLGSVIEGSPPGRVPAEAVRLLSVQAPPHDADVELARRRSVFAATNAGRLIAVRRELHAHPELAWREHRTRNLVRRLLAGQGLIPTAECGTGLVYDVVTGGAGSDGPTIALRADMDALPIDDEKDVAYRSTVRGAAHACGHDVHTTILVGAALFLAAEAHRLPPGRVLLIFQPAEETVPGGAQRLISDVDVMDGVDAIFALHCDPGLPTGTVGVRSGPITSACDRLRIVLEGRGGHAARPHLTTDLVHVTSLVGARLPGLVADRTGPVAPAAVVFGAVHAGTTHNVIPSRAELVGTVRTRSRSTWDVAPRHVIEALDQITDGFAVTRQVEQTRGAPPVENDPFATELMTRACLQLAGTTVQEVSQSLGAEDFSWYLDHAPGSYARLGVGRGGSGADLHSGQFDADETAIPLGVQLMASVAQLALSRLQRR